MHRFLAPEAAAGTTVELTSDEAHHLTHVLRLKAGDDVIVFDGRGQEWSGRVASASRSRAAVDVVARRPAVAEPPVAVTLAVAVLKGDQMDAVVRDATMLGVSVIVPLVTGHVAVSGAGVRMRSLDRWRRVAVASAKQCARAVVPEIRETAELVDVLDPQPELSLLCVEPSRAQGQKVSELPRPRAAVLCVGPEGGWSKDELQYARERGAALVSLGPRTLRAETAPTVALAALWTHWGWE